MDTFEKCNMNIKLVQCVPYSIVVHAMVKAGKLDEAFQMVELMRSHNLPTDTVLHTDLIKGCIDKGDVERAWNHYMAMGMVYGVPHDEVTLTVMIDACAIKGQAEKAMMLFRRLEEQMMAEPSEATFNSIIKAFSKRKGSSPQSIRNGRSNGSARLQA
ncbi:hypothetical protein C9374_014693 [Naegleria lovaniensis]|uniref:Pentatricopeptide repeat-containing protein-mitochondrial domain-containing protein n=1 Tax=Naegleria lovaniensis TaxID=51637 RepID=A0AA88KDH2_NAELO|nr:uncharacterized protein C9374_014693 [Naegleria lovaniensis]KAG2370677.1 hypothetical protein C9374_014693 [Naegleria lovaniensis]